MQKGMPFLLLVIFSCVLAVSVAGAQGSLYPLSVTAEPCTASPREALSESGALTANCLSQPLLSSTAADKLEPSARVLSLPACASPTSKGENQPQEEKPSAPPSCSWRHEFHELIDTLGCLGLAVWLTDKLGVWDLGPCGRRVALGLFVTSIFF